MREEYDISGLNPRRNPHSGGEKTLITINVDSSTIDYFQHLAEESGIPFQTVMNLYLRDCAMNQRKIIFPWK